MKYRRRRKTLIEVVFHQHREIVRLRKRIRYLEALKRVNRPRSTP